MISAKIAACVTVSVLALAGLLPAQGVTVEATSLTQLRVNAAVYINDPTEDTLPANHDLTAGVSLNAEQSQSAPLPAVGKASLSFSVEDTPSRITVKLTERTEATAGGNARARAGVGPHGIRVAFRSPRPMRARVTVRWCATQWGPLGKYDGRVDIIGYGEVIAAPGSSPFPCTVGDGFLQTFDVIIDSNGLVVNFETRGDAAGGGSQVPRGTAFGGWQVDLVPDPTFPCEIESYGNPCGATLTATSDFQHPGQHVITLEDSSRPTVAILGLGVQRQAVPIVGGCLLYHDLLVLLPWNIDPNGKAVLVFDPPAIPGLTFKAQAATLQGGTLHTTNALDVICR